MFSRFCQVVLATAATAVLVLTPPSPAFADGAVYANWTPDTMSIPLSGFPEASITSDATRRDPPTLGTWLGPDTPFGQVFGGSENKQYTTISTANGDLASASTTTFNFASPTPSGWGFTVGDVDADIVGISAIGADLNPLTPSELGFKGTFNYCAVSNPPQHCDNPGAEPDWHEEDGTLIGDASETDGASGWFQPTAPISQLEFRFQAQSGFPIYQLWFAALSRNISGTVALDDGGLPPPGSTLELYAPDRAVVATTTPDGDGNYQFTDVPSGPHKVHVALPEGYSVSGEDTQDADTTSGDMSDVDFSLTAPPTTPTTTPSSITTTSAPTTSTTVPPGPGPGPGPGPSPGPTPGPTSPPLLDGGGARNVPPASPPPPGARLPETGTATLIGGLLGLFGLGLGALLIALSRREEQRAYQPRHMARA